MDIDKKKAIFGALKIIAGIIASFLAYRQAVVESKSTTATVETKASVGYEEIVKAIKETDSTYRERIAKLEGRLDELERHMNQASSSSQGYGRGAGAPPKKVEAKPAAAPARPKLPDPGYLNLAPTLDSAVEQRQQMKASPAPKK